MTDERNYLQGCLDREVYKNTELNKQILTERKSKDKILLCYADQISVKNGLYAKFAQAVETLEPKKKETPEVDDKILWAAEQQRQADIDAEYPNVQPIDYYIGVIAENPAQYIL